MKSISGRKFARALERHGWVLKRIVGSHHIYAKDGRTTRISVPIHGNQDLKRGLLHDLMKEAGLKPEDI